MIHHRQRTILDDIHDEMDRVAGKSYGSKVSCMCVYPVGIVWVSVENVEEVIGGIGGG